MTYGIVTTDIATVWDDPSETEEKNGQIRSAISDEVLCGMGLTITGEAENGFYPVCTHYGYTGYVKDKDIRMVTLPELQAWETSDLMVVSGISVDITSIPKVQGVIYKTLFRGSLIKVLEFDSASSDQGEEGWAQVELSDGRKGYMRNQYLSVKKFSQAGLWESSLHQTFLNLYKTQPSVSLENEFRHGVVQTAMTYLGTQYRWGGKSTAGIDCSGLTSISYMLNGVLTYRDAQIKEGFPVHQISMEHIKEGDLMYFPGHIAMYIGNQRYIHSTGRIGSGGVVINSLNPVDPDYREDLVKCLYAVGSIF